jgi:hypothetical protein
MGTDIHSCANGETLQQKFVVKLAEMDVGE